MVETGTSQRTSGFEKVVGRVANSTVNSIIDPEFDLGIETGNHEPPRGDQKPVAASEGQRQSATRDSDSFGFDVIDPFDVGERSTDTPRTGRRGRPRGSKNRVEGKEAPKDLGSLGIQNFEALLFSIHFAAARLLDTKELEIDEDESKRLSDAIKNVIKEYPTVIDPKKLAVAQLCFVAVGIYGPRAVTLIKKGEKKEQAKPALVQPTPIRATPSQQPSAPSVSQPITNPSQLWADAPVENDLQ